MSILQRVRVGLLLLYQRISVNATLWVSLDGFRLRRRTGRERRIPYKQ